jgi:hypothetical protein
MTFWWQCRVMSVNVSKGTTQLWCVHLTYMIQFRTIFVNPVIKKFLQIAQSASEAHPASSGYRGSFPGVKRPGSEVDNSRPSSAHLKNKWSHASTTSICLHGLHRDNFTFTTYFKVLLLTSGPTCITDDSVSFIRATLTWSYPKFL